MRRPDDGVLYVQDVIEPAGEILRDWVERGASILVCGSLEGMAPAVDVALRRVVGDERVAVMAEDGLYRRDIY